MKVLDDIKKILNDRVLEIMYLIGIFLYSISKAFRPSALIDIPSKWIYYACVVLIVPKVVLTKYNKKEIVVNILIFSLTLLGYYFFKMRNLYVLPLVLIGVKNVNIKKVIKVVFVASIIFVVIHTVGYFYFHFKDGGTLVNLPLFDRGPNRSMVCCKYYNDYGSMCTMAIMQYIYLTDRNKNRLMKVIVLSLLSFVIYAIGTSRTALIIALMLIMYLLIENNNLLNSKLYLLKIIIFFFVVIISISMFYMDLDNSFVMILNNLLSGRVVLSNMGYHNIGLTLLPNVAKLSENTLAFDNFVVYIFLQYGLLIACGVLGLTMYLCVFRKHKSITDYLAIVMFIWALTERFNYYVTLTIVPMLVMHAFYQVEDDLRLM